MPGRIHFTCDPDFYAMGLSYPDRDNYEGDLHVLCSGWIEQGVRCECWCHSQEGERICGPLRAKRTQ
jgi:hypothetical protein